MGCAKALSGINYNILSCISHIYMFVILSLLARGEIQKNEKCMKSFLCVRPVNKSTSVKDKKAAFITDSVQERSHSLSRRCFVQINPETNS